MYICHLELIDWVVVLRPTQHKIGHFRDVPQANLLAWYGKTKPNTTKAHLYQSKEMHYNTKYAQLECGPMPNVMVALPKIGGALCSTPKSLADAHY